MYQSIIVPIDLSHPERSDAMLKAAEHLSSPGAKVILTYVVEEIPAFAAAELPADLLEASRKKAREELEQIAGKTACDTEVAVLQGQPSNTILRVADERNADLIIIASHRPAFQDYFLGSTASRVVRHAACAVHVMR